VGGLGGTHPFAAGDGLTDSDESSVRTRLSAVQNLAGPPPQYPIEAVDRALRLLALFREQPELRLSVVREHLGVGQSTAHRLMAMMVHHGFAVQDPKTKIYRAGPVLFEVGLAVVRNFDLRTVGRPIMERLAEQCGETVHLGTLEGASVRYVDCVESALALRVGSRVGQLGPAHATSLGKAMLAAMPDEAVRAIYLSPRLPSVTSKTITRLSDLMSELEGVRLRGYARNVEEMADGVCSVGAAIVHPLRGVAGAMSIAAPVMRVSDAQLDGYAEMLMVAAKEVAAAF